MAGAGPAAFRTDIEGLRAIAILLVVAFHSAAPGLSGGFVGVDVFFVVSGYLITSLLVHEAKATGRVDLLRFYARRARRLLPALLLTVVAVIAAGLWLLSPMEQARISETAFATSLYYSNVWFYRASIDYLAAQADDNPLLHTWSLAVEEQFYLVWPILAFLAQRLLPRERFSRDLGVVLSGFVLLSFAYCVYRVATIQPRAFFGAPARAWEFGAGAVAFLAPFPHALWRKLLVHRATPWIGLLLIVASAATYDRLTPFPGIAALPPALGTILVLASNGGSPSSASAQFLASGPMQWLGRRSYSWYLWHWPLLILGAAAIGPLTPIHRLTLCSLALLVAHLSFRYVEWPIRSLEFTKVRASTVAGLAIAASAFVAMLSVYWNHFALEAASSPAQRRFTMARGDLPHVYQLGCHRAYLDTDGSACSFGSSSASVRVVLMGDSHAAQWFPPFDRLADSLGWRLYYFSKSSCPIVTIPIRLERLKREYTECAEWRQRVFAEVGQLKPDLIVIANAAVYTTPTSSQTRVPLVSRAAWEQGSRDALAALKTYSGRVVVLADTPRPGFDVPTCLARAAWRGKPKEACSFASSDPETVELERAAASLQGVTLIDMGAAICMAEPCLPDRDGYVLFRDDNHLTASFSETLSGEVRMRLGKVSSR